MAAISAVGAVFYCVAQSTQVTKSTAIAQSTTQTSLTATLITAGAALVGALAGTFLKDYFFKLLEERRSEKRARRAVYERYSYPLALAAEALMWRLNEVLFHPGRAQFLRNVGLQQPPNKYAAYNNYKKLSTMYRLASLLGWARACQREFSFLRVSTPSESNPVHNAISALERALADGPVVEEQRLKRLCELWGLTIRQDSTRFAALGTRVESAMDDFMLVSNLDELEKLGHSARHDLCKHIADVICDFLDEKHLPDEILRETEARAFQALNIREAWLYRDWQTAIGDLMIRALDGAERRFDVISFLEFEKLYLSEDAGSMLWMSRLSALFDGVDMERADPYDYRPEQLRNVARATVKLVRAISQAARSPLSRETIDKAKSIEQRLRSDAERKSL